MAGHSVQVNDEGPVRWIALNRPDRLNAMTFEMWDELVEKFQDATADSRVRCVVLTGVGRGFCAGRDMEEAAAYLDDQPLTAERLDEMHAALIPLMVELRKPLIAAVNGPAVGVGLSLALACDLRVASEAARFGVGFLRVGLTPDAGATFLLPLTVGYSVALELAATGEVVDASRAFELGLVSRVVPAASFLQDVRALAGSLTEIPADAFAATKRLFQWAPSRGLRAALKDEAAAQPALLARPEYRERIESFLARRQARSGPKEHT